jgi:predicted nucleotidyltransferase
MYGLKKANSPRRFSQPKRGCRRLEAFLNMRLTDDQIQVIRQLASQVAGANLCSVRVFGSRLDDAARGGDIDLMLELLKPVDNPALMAAQLSAQVSRVMHGRKVDVLLSAPNLMRLPIHDMVFNEGHLL